MPTHNLHTGQLLNKAQVNGELMVCPGFVTDAACTTVSKQVCHVSACPKSIEAVCSQASVVMCYHAEHLLLNAWKLCTDTQTGLHLV